MEFTSTKKEGVLQNLSEVSTSNNFKSAIVSSPDKQDVADISTKSSSVCENVDKNASDIIVFSSFNKYQNDNTFNKLGNYNDEITCLDISAVPIEAEISINSAVNIHESINKDEAVTTTSSDYNISTKDANSFKVAANSSYTNIATVSSETDISVSSAANIHESINKDEAVATTSSGYNISTKDANSFKVAAPTNSSYINSRFTPGFTPKAKKRKFLGPAGFLEFVSFNI